MELNEAFGVIQKNLTDKNNELGFSKVKSGENEEVYTFSGEKGAYRLVYESDIGVLQFDCTHDSDLENPKWNTISKTLFDLGSMETRDLKSISNEIEDELKNMFAGKKKVDLDKIKMPKGVSRSRAKSGSVSYDADSLANRFGVLYPDMKPEIKQNIATYDEFLPETFFMEHGTARVIEVIRSGTEQEHKKLFKMLNEVFEDGTNEVQDIIAVTILGEMKGDPKLMEVADEYMIKYMADPVHEINKITKKQGSLVKKLENPPPYKPKKKSGNMLQNALNNQMQNSN